MNYPENLVSPGIARTHRWVEPALMVRQVLAFEVGLYFDSV